MKNSYEITDKNYILSALGNAYHSGLSFEQLWDCVRDAQDKTPKQIDADISAAIQAHEFLNSFKKLPS